MADGDLNDLGNLSNLTNLKELRELVEFLKASGVTQFDIERPEMKVRLKFTGPENPAVGLSGVDLATIARLLGSGGQFAPAAPLGAEGEHPVAALSVPAPAPVIPAEAVDEDAGLYIVKSPLVGTFYDSSSPGSEAFVKVGDRVEIGKVLCIVEAMKIMNEIENDAAGEIVKIFVKAGQPVEYGQPLFGIRR